MPQDPDPLDKLLADALHAVPRQYRPNPDAVAAMELSLALVRVLEKRHGPEFTAEMRAELSRRAALLGDGTDEDKIESPIIEQLITDVFGQDVEN